MKISVTQGVCRINSYHIIVDSKNVKIISFDTKDKYPEFAGFGNNSALISLAEESPSYCDLLGEIPFTEIEIDMGENRNEWKLMRGDTGRYTLFVVMYRTTQKEPKGVWLEEHI